MCRNIRPLFNFEPPSSESEIADAALQYVRKIGGFRKPSRANEAAFALAVARIAASSKAFIDALETSAAPRDRQAVERARKALAAKRPPSDARR